MKLKLDELKMEDAFFEESTLVGIATGMPAYRLCWMLNNLFDINFVCETDMTITILQAKKQDLFADMSMNLQDTDQEMVYLPVYQHQIPNSIDRYLLYKLKADNASLLPEIPRMDYLWLVQTWNHEEDAANIISELRKLPDIILSQVLERGQLKNLKNLLV